MAVFWRRGDPASLLSGDRTQSGQALAHSSPPEVPRWSSIAPRRSSSVRILSDGKELEEALRRAAACEQQLLEHLSRLASHYHR